MSFKDVQLFKSLVEGNEFIMFDTKQLALRQKRIKLSNFQP